MVRIVIRTSGAAFDEHPQHEIARTLKKIAEKIEHTTDRKAEGKVMDINGNAVGNWKLDI